MSANADKEKMLSQDHLTEPEIAERLNRGLKRAFTMKPQPHEKTKKKATSEPKREA